MNLIMECRQSGLSDYQWCKTKNINPGTFYNWVSKLRKIGYTFPVSESKSSLVPAKQEVVKLDLAEHEEPVCSMVEQNVSHPAITATANVAIEIKYGNMTLRLFNGADALVIQNTLKCIGGVSHAW